MNCCPRIALRVSIGDNSILGDQRWGGLFGIEAEFIALDDVKVTLSIDCKWQYKYSILYRLLKVPENSFLHQIFPKSQSSGVIQ